MTLLAALTQEPRRRARRAFLAAILGVCGALFGAVCLGFATLALFEFVRALYGAVIGALIVSGAYFFVSIAFLIGARRAGRDAGGARDIVREPGGAPGAEAKSEHATHAAVLAMGLDLAKKLTPLEIAVLAILSGFAAGRRL